MSSPENEAMTKTERWAVAKRILSDAGDRLAVGPILALAGGGGTVFCLAFWEGWSSIRTDANVTSKLHFTFRYALGQMIPSVVWASQPAEIIARNIGLDPRLLWGNATPPRSALLINRLSAIRGALAGSVLLSQVFSLTEVAAAAKAAYSERVKQGKEAPLDDPSQTGVVLRLAGNTSNVTILSMYRQGRRKLFPIFEEHDHPCVKQLVKEHGNIKGGAPQVPIFWQVDDGRYSHGGSWRGLVIPKQWLFDGRLLVLEADATTGGPEAMSLQRGMAHDFDLDLYEVAQGFHQLKMLCRAKEFTTLRVLLVDTEAIYLSGGGRSTSVRDHVIELGLADIIVDSRAPLLHAITKWLEKVESTVKVPRREERRPIILETPHKSWFSSIRGELESRGYDVMDRCKAAELYGPQASRQLPFLVYEKTTADTIHTIRQLVQRELCDQDKVCALAPRADFLEFSDMIDVSNLTFISSSDIFDRLLKWVRTKAIEGVEVKEIQRQLDYELDAVVAQIFEDQDGIANGRMEKASKRKTAKLDN